MHSKSVLISNINEATFINRDIKEIGMINFVRNKEDCEEDGALNLAFGLDAGILCYKTNKNEQIALPGTSEKSKITGFTKFVNKPDSTCDMCGSDVLCFCNTAKMCRKPAQICKPSRAHCRPRRCRLDKCDLDTLSQVCCLRPSTTVDSATRISASLASICCKYESPDHYASDKPIKSQPSCWPCASIDALGNCCQSHSFPPAPPICSDDCYSVLELNNNEPGHHPPPKPKPQFIPLDPPSPQLPCLPLPPIIPKPDYSCPCTCNCEDTDSDLEVNCQNSLDDESPLSKFFQDKLTKLSEDLEKLCKEVDEKSKDLEECLKEKQKNEADLSSAENEVLDACKAVKKLECELMNIRNRICISSLYCINEEKEETFCCKIAVQHVRVLQSKLEKVRSGAKIKTCMLDMCKESRTRLTENNNQLRSDITAVQEIAKKIKENIDEIKSTICKT